jgi:UDP-N-acetylmuramoyl-tripeptide--D-alanyl-D-alanine ligase
MIPMTLAEIAAVVGGRSVGGGPDLLVTGPVEFDSRKIAPGGLFVAFDGERVDGHDFAAAAAAAGAVGVLGSRQVDGVPTVVVDDPRAAMGRLARTVLDRLPSLTVIALTGSSGKTTTKDLLAGLLAEAGSTVAPPGSLNNELGAPYTALRATADTRFLVMEMGSRGPGHLRYLCEIAPPTIGIVTNVGVAHLGEFGSVDAIATAKSELVEALPAGGVAILNADDDRVRAMAARTTARVVLAGEAADRGAWPRVALDARAGPLHAGVARRSARVAGRLGPPPGGQLAAGGRRRRPGCLVRRSPRRSAGCGWPRRRMDVFDGRRRHGYRRSHNANPSSSPRRCGRSRPWVPAGVPSRCSATSPNSASTSGPATRRSGGPRHCSGSTGWWLSGTRQGRSGTALPPYPVGEGSRCR